MPTLRRRRTRIQNLSPAQQDVRRELHKAETWVEIVSWGIAESMKSIYDIDDYEQLRELMEEHLRPALAMAKKKLDLLRHPRAKKAGALSK